MKTTHTPKGWTVSHRGPSLGPYRFRVYDDGTGNIIAEISDTDDANTTAASNARLIAAAPDLLAACEALHAEVLAYLTAQNLHGEHNPAMVAASAAIAKAKGNK